MLQHIFQIPELSSSSQVALLSSELTADEQDMVPRADDDEDDADDDTSDDSEMFSDTVSKVELRFLLLFLTTADCDIVEVPDPKERLRITACTFKISNLYFNFSKTFDSVLLKLK